MKKIVLASLVSLTFISMSASAMVTEKVQPNQDKIIVSNISGFSVPADNFKNIKYTDLQELKNKEDMKKYMSKITKDENAKFIFSGSVANVGDKPSALSISRDIPYLKSVTHHVSGDGKTDTKFERSVFQEGFNIVLKTKEDNGFIRTQMDFVNNSLFSIDKGDVKKGKPDLINMHTFKTESSFITRPNQVVKFDTPVYLRDGKKYRDVYFIQQDI